jgi:hypothetical protein
MATRSWIREAKKLVTLKITENWNCPFCNPTRDVKTLMMGNACEKDL